MLIQHNPFVREYRTVAERMRIAPHDDFGIRISGNSNLGRQYDMPSTAEVAAILPGATDSEEASAPRDVLVVTKNGGLQRINELNACYDPLHYVLLFPCGETGWHPNLQLQVANANADMGDADREEDDDDEEREGGRHANTRLTARMFYAYMLQKRPGQYLIHAGRLLHEYIVDNYAKMETQRLGYLRNNQGALRADLYQGAVDALHATDGDVTGRNVGSRVILPSSFTGGPRYMQQQFQDATAIVKSRGKPDLFITFTCNPNWPEIQNTIETWQQASDRPDVICRVFREKLDCLMKDIKSRQIFGIVRASIHVVEFQKRGLPHAHILIILANVDKPLTPEDIDQITCAEMPDPVTEPSLYQTVTGSMIHRPCGRFDPSQPCTKNSFCTRGYPKPFSSETIIDERGYVQYRRRNNSAKAIPRATRGRPHLPPIDNSWVVPYNKYLSLKYDAHINVEICSKVEAVKYLFKYVYKGLDRASVRLSGSDDQATAQNLDEISQWQNTRYVSTTEAIWRLYGYRIQQQSPSITRMDVHLPDQQRVTFADDADMARVVAQRRETRLTAWFILNREDSEARTIAYIDIPRSYRFNKETQRWIKRTNTLSIIGRIYFVNRRETERYALRLLLLNVCGATSWESLRTVDGVTYDTFNGAATV